ncbi:MAG: PAS domain S-box protein [Bacteroidia bacterium]
MFTTARLYSFEKKLFIAFTCIILAAIFIFYVLSKNNADFIDTSRWVEHTKDVLQGAEKIRYHIKEIENESRTYVITGKAGEITAFNHVIDTVEQHIRFLKQLTADNQNQQARLDSLMLDVKKRITFANALMKERELNGFEAAKSLLETGAGFALTKKIEGLVDTFQQEENMLLEKRKQKNQENINASYNLIRIFQAGIILVLVAVLIVILSTLRARRLSQEELSESREWLSKTLTGIGDAVIATDKNGIISFINPVGERLTGWASAEAIGKPLDFIFEVINEDTRQIVENPVKKVLREKTIIDLAASTKLVRKDKAEVAIDDSAAPIYNNRGELIGVVLVFRDVEKQRAAEKELKQANERFNKIISISPVALGICTAADGKFLYVNESFEKIIALQKEHIIGKTAPEIGIQSSEEKSRVLNTALAQEGRVKSMELQINSSTGEVKDILVSIESFEMDGQNCILFATVDITERRKIEIQIERNNAFLNTVLENIPNMIFVKDAEELRFLRFNKAGEELLGYSKSDLIGKNDYDFFPKEQADFFIEKDKETLREGKLLDIPQEEIDSKDKGKRWLHTKKIPVNGADGRPLYLLGISEDITDRKEQEDAIRALNADLEDNIQQLKHVNKELESFSYYV